MVCSPLGNRVKFPFVLLGLESDSYTVGGMEQVSVCQSMKYVSVLEEADVVEGKKLRTFVVCTWNFQVLAGTASKEEGAYDELGYGFGVFGCLV
jgi:hypothetical protein